MASKNSKQQEIIRTLKACNFYLECPKTNEEVAVKAL